MIDHLLGKVLGPLDLRVYRFLSASGPRTLEDIAPCVDADVDSVAASVQRLTDLGFARPDEAELVVQAVPLAAALTLAAAHEEADILARSATLAKMRGRATQLLKAEYTSAADACPVMEVVSLAGNPRWFTHQLAATATESFDRLVPSIDLDAEPELRDNVAHRAVYASHVLKDDANLRAIVRQQVRGVEVRHLPDLKEHAVVADAENAFITLNDEQGILLGGSALPVLLARHFSLLWDRATPLFGYARDGARDDTSWRISNEDAAVLRLLAAGLKDQAIARHLGIGLRTVVRRIGNLSKALDAETRFQAGVQAARRGLL